MTRQERKAMREAVQDTLIHHMKSAFYEADDNHWSEEKRAELLRQAERVSRFLGYETLGGY